MNKFLQWIDSWRPGETEVDENRRYQKETLDDILFHYEREIKISKKICFYSAIVLGLVITYYSFNRPVNLNEISFIIFALSFAIPASLFYVSAQCYCMSKCSWLSFKEKEARFKD